MTEERLVEHIAEAIELCDKPFSSEHLARDVLQRLREIGAFSAPDKEP